MKKIIFNNLSLKLLSVFVGIITWILIVNIDDPVITRKFSNISVTTVNDSVIYNEDKVYQITNDSKSVDVYINAKRSVMRFIKEEYITAEADFNDVMMDGIIPINVKLSRYQSQIEDIYANPNNMVVSIEDKTSKNYSIDIETQGDIAKGYFVSEKKSTIEAINVSGPKSIISKIKKVVAQVKITNLTKDKSYNVKPVYIDNNGDVITSELITSDLDETGIDVTITVFKAKNVPVRVETQGSIASGYAIDDITTSPSSVDIIGTKEMMDSVNEILISGEKVNVDGFNTTMENTISIKDFIPEGVSLADYESDDIIITITISPSVNKELSYPVDLITVENTAHGFKVDYGNTKNITIVISGNKKYVDKITASDITVVLDIRTLREEGEYTQSLSVIAENNIKLAQQVNITFRLVKE